MWLPKGNSERKDEGNGLVALAIDKDKGSQCALKWAVDHLLSRGQTLILIHINQRVSSIPGPMGNHVSISDVKDNVASAYKSQLDAQTRELFLPFRCYCIRKDIHCKDVILEDMDVAKAIIEYISHSAIENLVIGASTRNAFLRFKSTDIPGSISKGAPDFCTVYVISKGKISSVRSASRPAPTISPLRNQIQMQNQSSHLDQPEAQFSHSSSKGAQMKSFEPASMHDEIEHIRSPFTRRGLTGKSYGDLPAPDTDISFVSSGRPSIDRMFPSLYDHLESGRTPRLSTSSDHDKRMSFETLRPGNKSGNDYQFQEYSTTSQDSGVSSYSSQNMEDVEAEMRRLKLELKQTMDMYSTACKEALTAKQKAMELHRWKMEEEQKFEDARMAEEAALKIAEKEKAKCRAAIEAAEASQRIAELEAQKRVNAEMKAYKESEEKKKVLDALANSDVRYRKYTIDEIEAATEFFIESRKIGEGGYGPVYKCYLDHTQVAIKVLRPDAAQGRSQFQQEVEVLSCIRHPNMVLLLGACPEYGCLVYEYMANGSLEDRLFRRGNSPVLSWQLRFRIAAEIGTGLLFLHQTKPEPLVHRDLKPANILLDRNYVSKISDVGLARLVPPSVSNNVTQYRMTSTAGTFCYIDPEYQQTGMLGIKSDIYSLGIMLLQVITAKPPMGLTHHVERAIEKGTFAEMLDPEVPDWPLEEALCFAKLALGCAELRRKDRPDLGKVILPELNRLRELAEENMPMILGSTNASPTHSQVSMRQDVLSDPLLAHSGYDSSRSRSSGASFPGRRSNPDM
ncbi:U-box domain-containing protein 35-like isoform X2 [Macadamia integrifolia]|uniref:U-box domain-containing protein 35-like isoform X2 n=1 Tax=Macadamia integrifolia TaxID=60698 RepID=UPI001C4FDE77|nr:U-box domain-containing protein 35-like isoform X2 [Macadamia integrifolia]